MLLCSSKIDGSYTEWVTLPPANKDASMNRSVDSSLTSAYDFPYKIISSYTGFENTFQRGMTTFCTLTAEIQLHWEVCKPLRMLFTGKSQRISAVFFWQSGLRCWSLPLHLLLHPPSLPEQADPFQLADVWKVLWQPRNTIYICYSQSTTKDIGIVSQKALWY